jgi:hypothetical protein
VRVGVAQDHVEGVVTLVEHREAALRCTHLEHLGVGRQRGRDLSRQRRSAGDQQDLHSPNSLRHACLPDRPNLRLTRHLAA